MYTTTASPEAVLEACQYFGIDLNEIAMEAVDGNDKSGDSKKAGAIAKKIGDGIKGAIPTIVKRAKDLKDKVVAYVRKVLITDRTVEVNNEYLTRYKKNLSVISSRYPKISSEIQKTINDLMSGDVADTSNLKSVCGEFLDAINALPTGPVTGSSRVRLKLSSLTATQSLLKKIEDDLDRCITGLEKAKAYADKRDAGNTVVNMQGIPQALSAISTTVRITIGMTNVLMGSEKTRQDANAAAAANKKLERQNAKAAKQEEKANNFAKKSVGIA